MSPSEPVFRYHERTKHHPYRYAEALGYLDWATQPDPFRRFEGAPSVRLAEVAPTPAPTWDAVLGGGLPPAALDLPSLSQLFYDSLALSAWKQYQSSRWALRVNPSSGNLHPTEGYLVTGGVAGTDLSAGVHHYAPRVHELELRRALSAAQWAELARDLPRGAILIGFTSILWREAWKYGERAFRYCNHDVGHAIGAMALAASALGWETRLLEGGGDDDVAVLLGTHVQHGPEAEHADCLLVLHPRDVPVSDARLRRAPVSPAHVAELRASPPLGTPNRLSAAHHDWPAIGDVAEASRRSGAPPASFWGGATVAHGSTGAPAVSARALIRQRRSAVDMDGKTRLSRAAFHAMLASVQPGLVPFRALPWRPRVHLALFVHRVDDVTPGIWCLVRDAGARPALTAAMRADLLWDAPDPEAADLGLYLLAPIDCRSAARTVSCHQDIAADGAFAVAMLAEFEAPLRELGPWFYRRLHWETGAVGQVLYLAAEAAGVRATGIGCFFDDALHQALGITGRAFQTLYHFTVGGAVEDERLQTSPAYAHLAEERAHRTQRAL